MFSLQLRFLQWQNLTARHLSFSLPCFNTCRMATLWTLPLDYIKGVAKAHKFRDCICQAQRAEQCHVDQSKCTLLLELRSRSRLLDIPTWQAILLNCQTHALGLGHTQAGMGVTGVLQYRYDGESSCRDKPIHQITMRSWVPLSSNFALHSAPCTKKGACCSLVSGPAFSDSKLFVSEEHLPLLGPPSLHPARIWHSRIPTLPLLYAVHPRMDIFEAFRELEPLHQQCVVEPFFDPIDPKPTPTYC